MLGIFYILALWAPRCILSVKIGLKTICYKNEVEKDATLEIQKKLVDILKIKRDTQTANQESDLDSFPI